MQEDTYYGQQGDPLSLNLYTYCHNDPIKYHDPTGHWAISDGNYDFNTQLQLILLSIAYYEFGVGFDSKRFSAMVGKVRDAGGTYSYVNNKDYDTLENFRWIFLTAYVKNWDPNTQKYKSLTYDQFQSVLRDSGIGFSVSGQLSTLSLTLKLTLKSSGSVVSMGINKPSYKTQNYNYAQGNVSKKATKPTTTTPKNDGVVSISDQGIGFVADYEKFYALPYRGQDSQNRTVGYGHVITKSDGTKYDDGITEEEALNLLLSDLAVAMKYVNEFLITYQITLTQNQFDALVSFTFNAGPDWITKASGLKDVLISKNFSKVGDEMMRWIYVNGQKSEGLYRRRADEVQIFYNEEYTRDYPNMPK